MDGNGASLRRGQREDVQRQRPALAEDVGAPSPGAGGYAPYGCDATIPPMTYRFEAFELDTDRYELRRDGEAVRMEPQVFDVLAYLVENHDRMVPKDELLEKVWGDKYISEAAVNSRLMAARRAVGDSGKEQRLIRTMHGRGFRFVGDVDQDGDGAAPKRDASAPPAGLALTPERPEQVVRFCTASD